MPVLAVSTDSSVTSYQRVGINAGSKTLDFYRVGQKTELFLRVNNFATVGGRNACDMSKFGKFYLEKNIKITYQCVKYSLPNLHKYSMFLKLPLI